MKHKIILLPENLSLKDHFLILLGKSRLGGEVTLGSIQLRLYFKAQSSVKESARGIYFLNLFSSITNSGISLSTNIVEMLFWETGSRLICRLMTFKDQVCNLLAKLLGFCNRSSLPSGYSLKVARLGKHISPPPHSATYWVHTRLKLQTHPTTELSKLQCMCSSAR